MHFNGAMVKPMREALDKAEISKRVTPQGLRRSFEDALRRLGVAGPVAEAVMGHNARMRSAYSTVAVGEVARLGTKIGRALKTGTRAGTRRRKRRNGPRA
jgi:integrase